MFIRPVIHTLLFACVYAFAASGATTSRVQYAQPGYLFGVYDTVSPGNMTLVKTVRELVFPGATLEELATCDFAGVFCGASVSTKEEARAYHVKAHRTASGTLDFLLVPIQKADDANNCYVKCAILKLTEEADGVWAQAVGARYYKSTSSRWKQDAVNIDFVNLAADGSYTFNHQQGSAATGYSSGGYGVCAFSALAIVPATAPALAFTNTLDQAVLTVEDLKDRDFSCRVIGLSCSPNKYEIVPSANKRIFTDPATGRATKITLEMQFLSDNWIKCPIVELSNAARGVQAQVVSARYVTTNGNSLGYPFVKDDGTFNGNASEIATHVLTVGYGVAGLATILPPLPPFEGPDQVSASVPPGFYTNTVSLALQYDDPAAEIHYTLDGSTPTVETNDTCFVYRGPLALADICSQPNPLSTSSAYRTNPPELANNSYKTYAWAAPKTDLPNAHVLRARAFKGEQSCTNEFAGTWFVGPVPNSHTLRVASFITDNTHLFSDATGLFVPGNIYKANGFGSSVGKPNANYFQSGDRWERPAHFELFETNHAAAASCNLGIRMHGGFSRAWAQKTLRCCLRAEYGQKNINYPLFSDDPYTKYKRFLLRNSGNDWCYTGFRDAVAQQIFRPFLHSDTQGYVPTVVYINGEYWGILNLRHHYSKHFFERKYGVDPENIDFLKYNASGGLETAEGDQVAYNELLSFLNTHPLADRTNYADFCTRVDVDSLIDDYILHVFLAVTDWPHNNQGIWRERVAYTNDAPPARDGRWRWVAYDTDSGSSLPVISNSLTIDSLSSSYAKKNPIFKACYDCPMFITNFVNRTADLLNTALLPERSQAIIDQAAATVAPEIPRHIARWTQMKSAANWTNEVQIFRAFFSKRIPNLLQYMNNRFALGSASPLTVDVVGGGTVRVNSLTSAGPNATITLPWTGSYFANYAVTLLAAPKPGWEFTGWSLNGRTVTTPDVTVTVSAATTAIAQFRKAPLPEIRINEVMSESDGDDWFELYNAGSTPVSLKGCWLTDDSDKHLTEITDDITLAPHAFLLVRTGDVFTPGLAEDGVLQMPFGLSKKGDQVRLLAFDRETVIDQISFGALKKNRTEGRTPDGARNWLPLRTPTPGSANASAVPHFSLRLR